MGHPLSALVFVRQVVLPGRDLILPGEVVATAVLERGCKSLVARSPAVARNE